MEFHYNHPNFVFSLSSYRLASKNPYPAQSGTKNSDNAAANLSAGDSADAAYFEKSTMPQEELQAKAAAQTS